jgi:hypothetical protein
MLMFWISSGREEGMRQKNERAIGNKKTVKQKEK